MAFKVLLTTVFLTASALANGTEITDTTFSCEGGLVAKFEYYRNNGNKVNGTAFLEGQKITSIRGKEINDDGDEVLSFNATLDPNESIGSYHSVENGQRQYYSDGLLDKAWRPFRAILQRPSDQRPNDPARKYLPYFVRARDCCKNWDAAKCQVPQTADTPRPDTTRREQRPSQQRPKPTGR